MIAGMKKSESESNNSSTSSPPSMIPGITGERGYGISVRMISRKLRKARPGFPRGLSPDGEETKRCLSPERHEASLNDHYYHRSLSPTRRAPRAPFEEQILSRSWEEKQMMSPVLCGEK